MAKKIFARARVIKGVRWSIDYTTFDLQTQKERRHRHEFNLNEIPDLAVRELVADALVANITIFARQEPSNKSDIVTVKQAVELARDIKFKLPRKSSQSHYRTVSRRFIKWLSSRKYASMEAPDFTKKFAREYWDHLINSNQYAGRTLNNYLNGLKSLWTEMIEREITPQNPWTNIKATRVGEKLRRPFTRQECDAVARWAEKNDYWMFRGILLQFFCYIRPGEISRLKFRDFDFSTGSVTIQAGNAKTWKKRVATIPQSVIHYFIDGKFDKFPGNYFVYGRIPAVNGRWELYPSTTALNIDRMNKRHARTLARLKEAGVLQDITGLTWYSWKDTGISFHTRITTPVATKDQAGHKDLSITSLYYHADEINLEYKVLDNDLFL